MARRVVPGVILALLLALSLLASDTRAREPLAGDAGDSTSLSSARADADDHPAVHVARLEGVVDPIAAQYVTRVVEQAERANATALVILLDTPGGLDSAMRTMTQRMLGATVPVVIYVSPPGARAASAGVFLTLAAHVAAMAPGTNIGAAHPVSLGGGQDDPVMAGKVANDAAALARALAGQRGRNAGWADRAVRDSISATETEALAEGVIDLVARDLDDLLDQADGRVIQTSAGPRTLATRDAPRLAAEMSVAELLLHALLNPNVAFILLNLGILGLLAEFYHPGALIPGLSGVIAILLALVALGSLPVNGGGVLLLLLAFALFIVDIHVTTHGVLSVAGVVAFVLGGLLLFSPLDAGPWRPGPLAVSPALVGGVAVLFVVYFLIVVRASLRLRHAGSAMWAVPGAGSVAIAVTDLAPGGIVRLDDEDWSAWAESESVRAGEVVDVVAREGLHLRVRPRAPAPDGAKRPGGEVIPSPLAALAPLRNDPLGNGGPELAPIEKRGGEVAPSPRRRLAPSGAGATFPDPVSSDPRPPTTDPRHLTPKDHDPKEEATT
ncbi:MAG: nodulation protein NfeD [Chloroflexi bacterium]|nr:nodulation protein NfeD [Chloroflexota bacterium]